jgi:hypothetical protein
MILPSVDRELGFDPRVERDPKDFLQRLTILQSIRQRLGLQAAPVDTILIVDLSHHNGICDFKALRASGVKGIVLKCSEGDSFKDPEFESNWQKARDEDFGVMVYHFHRDYDTASAQFSWFMTCAENFLNAVDGHTAVANDVELNNGASQAARANIVFDFCAMTHNAGLKSGVYSSPSKVSALFPPGETRWNNLDFLWNAAWTSADTPTMPAGWSVALMKLWQFGISPTYAWCPPISGGGNATDVNYGYFVSEEGYKMWLGQAEEPVPALPKLVRVKISSYAPVRSAPNGVGYRFMPVGALMGVSGSTTDDKGVVWYKVNDKIDEFVKSDHVEVVE